jgi:hypothetical protein
MAGTVAVVLTPLPAHGQIEVPEEVVGVVVDVDVDVDEESDDEALLDDEAEPPPHPATRLEPNAAVDTPSQRNAWRREMEAVVAVAVRLLMMPPVRSPAGCGRHMWSNLTGGSRHGPEMLHLLTRAKTHPAK